jgi:hypothetical protein
MPSRRSLRGATEPAAQRRFHRFGGAIGMVGGMVGAARIGASNQLMSQLGMELDKMGRELADMRLSLSDLARSFKDAYEAPSAPLATPLGAPSGKVGPLIAKLAYIAVLKHAMEKAASAKHFNVETAINDLWIHLDAIKRLGSMQSTAASDAGSARELLKLRATMQKQQQMFQMLSDLMKGVRQTTQATLSTLRG